MAGKSTTKSVRVGGPGPGAVGLGAGVVILGAVSTIISQLDRVTAALNSVYTSFQKLLTDGNKLAAVIIAFELLAFLSARGFRIGRHLAQLYSPENQIAVLRLNAHDSKGVIFSRSAIRTTLDQLGSKNTHDFLCLEPGDTAWKYPIRWLLGRTVSQRDLGKAVDSALAHYSDKKWVRLLKSGPTSKQQAAGDLYDDYYETLTPRDPESRNATTGSALKNQPASAGRRSRTRKQHVKSEDKADLPQNA